MGCDLAVGKVIYIATAFPPPPPLVCHLNDTTISYCWWKIQCALVVWKLASWALWLSRFLLAVPFFFSHPLPFSIWLPHCLFSNPGENPGISSSKSWLQTASSAMKLQWCRRWVIAIHPANVWWHHSVARHGPSFPPIFSYTVWSGFRWATPLEV